jgi:tRNA 2-selenouridine synthase
MVVLGGYTGSGKTEILHQLDKMGEQVIDLEALASHKGSVFGSFGLNEQPTNEQFENNLYENWKLIDYKRRVWIEDESRSIGSVSIPVPLHRQMQRAKRIFIKLDKNIRIERLVNEYSGFDPVNLIDATELIRRKLGGDNCNRAILSLGIKNYTEAADILLSYYDKAYIKGLKRHNESKVYEIIIDADNPQGIADKIIKFVNEQC